MSIISPPRVDDLARARRRCRRRRLRPTAARSRVERLWRGPESDPAWVRPALLIVLLAATAALYLWDLGASGWANSYYSAAVQAGTKSWKAFFFGSTDAVELHHGRQDARRRCGSWRSRRASSA